MKRFAALLLILAFMLSLGGFVLAQDDMGGDDMMGPSVMVAPDGTVRLGFAAALTGEGLSAFGIDIRRGVELALEDRPTVTVGELSFPVEFDAQDSQCTPEGGQTVANRFAADDTIVAVVGPMCSSACAAAIPIFDDAMMSNVSASCTAAVLTNSGSMTFNRTVTSDPQQVAAAVQFITETLGLSSIAIIDDGSTYGAGLGDTIEVAIAEAGGEVVARDAVTVGDTDFRALLENIANAEPELIYFGGFNAEAARLIEQRFDVGLEDVPFMGADGIFGPELIELVGDNELVEGVYSSAPAPVSSDELDAFRTRYVETYGEEPPSAFNTNSYDATMLILDAIEAVGYIDDRGDLVIERADLAEALRSASIDGLTGQLVCDGMGDCATGPIAIYQVQDGEYVQIDTIAPNSGDMMDDMDDMGEDDEDSGDGM